MTNSEFYPIIEVIDYNFLIPQLGRRRRIAALLPHDYYKTDKFYPVIYLHDGQNLFDEAAPFGNWGVDKSLNLLSIHGRGDIIVIAIDHGGTQRIKELIPYKTRRFNDSEGDKYIDFMMNTLKPLVDSRYRIRSDVYNTGIGGSSLGGLISLYAGMKYPDVFGKLMIFSPSLWLSSEVYKAAKKIDQSFKSKIILYAGGMESPTHLKSVEKLADILRSKENEYNCLKMKLVTNPKGRHQEVFWADQFPFAIDWLFF